LHLVGILFPHVKSTNTHLEYVTHCFCITTTVARTCLNVTLYEHCLSC